MAHAAYYCSLRCQHCALLHLCAPSPLMGPVRNMLVHLLAVQR
jgi:hypothetical protein